MTRDVEERIVAMYFDNEDFEKKAKTTIETLGQLQKGMNLEESAKGFDVFEKIGKTLNFDKAQKGLSKIKSTMNGMGSIFKKVFNLGPIDEAAAAVENFKNRYLNRVLGFDLAHTVANALEGAFRQLTIQPISAGWTQYENKMDSVKTIMSSTGQSIGVVQKHLEDLTTYANKTIYSLSDMTSNLGKFTNNGQDLDKSVMAMKGIANAAADAGQGAQQASMAMYNFSQAMGVGKMTTIDWKSIENANMATTRLKETFMEMAAANGTLQKEFDETTKKYHYYVTKNSKGQTEKDKKKWTEVTAKNFRETLSKDWLTSDAMMHALQIYSGDVINASTFKSWGITDPEQIKALEKIGKDAYEAATQVRTFTKMMDALREAAQSGWADTFELIFGDMEQGTTLWTTINDVIDPILSKSAKARNDMLQIWAGTSIDTKNEEQELADKTAELDALNKKLEELQKTGKNKGEIEKTISDISTLKGEIGALYKVIAEKKNTPKSIFLDEQGRTGREILFDKETGALFRLIELAQKLGGAFSEAFKSVFGEMNAEKLFNLTKQIGDGVENMFKWFTEKGSEKETSRLEKITTGLKGVFSIVKTVVNFLKMGFNLLKRLVAPVADFLINAFEKFGEFFNGLGELSPVEVFQKLGEGLQKTWEKVKKFFTPQDILDKNGKSTGKTEIPVISWLRNVWTNFKKTVKGWAEENGLGEVWAKVSEWWNSATKTFNEGKAELERVWNQVKKWFEESGISGFLSNTWAWIVEQFEPTKQYDESGNVISNGDAPIVTWLSGIWESIETFWNDTILGTAEPIWRSIAEFVSNTWGWIQTQFGINNGSRIKQHEIGIASEKEAPIVTWLSGIWESIETFWNDTILGTAEPIWRSIAEFAGNTWSWIKAQFSVNDGSHIKQHEVGATSGEAPIVTWLSGIWNSIETFWNDTILGTAEPIWRSIAEFAGNTWSWIKAQFGANDGSRIKQHEIGITSEKEAPIVTWLSGIWESIETFWNDTIVGTATPIWNAISKFAGDTWSWISDQFGTTNEDGTKREEAPIITWLSGIWNSIETFWNDTILGTAEPIWRSIAEFVSNTWGWIQTQFGINNGSRIKQHEIGIASEKEAPIVTWLSGIWEDVKGVWDSIVAWEGWGALGEFLSNTWTWIVGLFSGSEESVAGASEAAIEASKNTTATPEKTEESLDFFGRIMEVMGDFIKKVVETVNGAVIPEGISTFLKGAGDFITGAFKVIGDILGSFGKWFNKGWNSDEMTSEDKWNIILSIVGIIGTVVTQLFAAHWMSKIDGMSSIGTQFLEFAGGLLLIAGAVSLLTTIDSSKMQAGAKILAGLALAIGVVLFAVGQIKSATTSTPTTGTERFFTNLINKLALLGALGIITSALPGIIKAVSEAKASGVENLGEDILKIAEAMSLLFSSVGLTLGVIMAIAPTGVDPAAVMKTVLALSGAVYALYAVINFMGGLPELIGDKGAQATLANLDRGGAILEKLGIAIGGFFGAMIGAFTGGVSEGAVVAAANGLSQTTDVLSQISTEDINKFSIMLDFVAQLLEGFGSSTALDIFDRIATGGKLKTLGDQLPALATGIDSIMSKVKTYTDEDVNRFRECVRFINYFANAMALVAAATSGKTGFWVYDVDQAVFQEYMEAAEQLSEAVKKGLMNGDGSMTGLEFNAMPIIDAICKALEGGEYAISTAVKKMVNAGLKRVDTDGASGASRLTVPDEVVTFYQQFSGKFKTENGSTFDLNEAISQFMGDDGEFTRLMNLFDTKTSDLEQKWGKFTNVFDNFDLLKIKKLNTETGEEEEVSAVSFMQEQLDTLSAAVKESGGLEVTITPVFNMSNMTRDKLQGALDAELGTTPLSANATFDNPTVTIDFKTLSSELDMAGIHNKLQSMLYQMAAADSNNQAAINRLGNDISDLADAVSDMKLVLDTGVLVGQITPQIDAALGQRSARFSRTGVVYVNP